MSKIAEKKKRIIAYITKNLKRVDPEGKNIAYYVDLISNMSDTQFDTFMQNMRDGNFQFHLIVPNMGPKFSMDDILATAKTIGHEMFHKIWITDQDTGQKYLSSYAYPILQLPIRRQQQFLEKKMSVPSSDRKIDGMTGQVTGDDRASSITSPEIQALHARSLRRTLSELVTMRGGDTIAYGEFRRQLEETGEVKLVDIPGGTVSRTAAVTQTLLEAMHLQNNLVSRED